jgi:hypothetical protein
MHGKSLHRPVGADMFVTAVTIFPQAAIHSRLSHKHGCSVLPSEDTLSVSNRAGENKTGKALPLQMNAA